MRPIPLSRTRRRRDAGARASSRPYDACVVVTTYNRPGNLQRLLEDVQATRSRWDLRVRVYDDCSSTSYADARAVLAAEGWDYVRAAENHGKKAFWRWMTRIYSELRKEPARYFFFLQDDVRLCSDFFDRAIGIWRGIDDPTKVSMMLVRDSNRQVGPGWTRARPVRFTATWRTGWIDCIFMAERRYLEALGYRVRSPGNRWRRGSTLGSGVGSLNSKALYRKGLGMHCVSRSLVALVQERSQMNPRAREESPCWSVGFIDGEERHKEVMTPPRLPTMLYLGVHEKNFPWGAEVAMSRGFEGRCRQLKVDFRARPKELARDLDRLCARSDFCFLQNGVGMPLSLLKRIRIPLCFFASEASRPGIEAHMALIESRRPELVLSHTGDVERFCRERSIPVVRVVNAHNSSQYRFLDRAPLYDVALVGSITGRRSRLVDELRAADPALEVLAESCFDPLRVNEIYNSSRIVLHLMAGDGLHYLPTRLFEVMPTAAALVCEDLGRAWVPEDVRGTFESFRTGDVGHLLEVVRRLLHGDRWRQLARKGQEAAPAHTWARRASEFWELMSPLIERPA